MKSTAKKAFHRGFTLIELMIVIVILGILMGAILPRLSGAQGRARDTARISDLNTIAQALELYRGDFGQFPGTTGTPDCLDDTFDSVFKTYFKGEVIPTPPTSGEVTSFDTVNECPDAYQYIPLDSKGINAQAYAIVANVEVPTKGNYIAPVSGVSVASAFDYDADSSVETLLPEINADPNDLAKAEGEDVTGAATLYMIIN